MKAPAFQFYAADFLADKNVAVMSAGEVGAYILLISYCWREGELPDDTEELALLARIPVEQFEKSWEKRIKRCFEQNAEGQWVHPRLEVERAKQADNREKKRHAAQVRHNPNGVQRPTPVPQSDNPPALQMDSTCNADAYQTQCPSSSSSSATASNTHAHFAGAREDDPSAYQRGSPPDPITAGDANPAELPPTVEHFALMAHWEVYHVGLDLDTQARVAAAVTDPTLWTQALNFWVDNGYRGRSIGKIVKKYRELEAERGKGATHGTSNGKRSGGTSLSDRNEAAIEAIYAKRAARRDAGGPT